VVLGCREVFDCLKAAGQRSDTGGTTEGSKDVMENDQRVCPRCGEPAGDYRFCGYCRAHMDSLTGTPTPVATHATSAQVADPTYLAAQVLRLEQALAAASQGIGDRIAGAPSAAVQVEAEPRPAEPISGDVAAVSLERATFPEVARLEDVLTVAPADPGASAATPVDPATHVTAPPAEELERLAIAEAPLAEPIYVAAQALREAFWFEQTAAFRAPQTPLSDAPAAEPARLESVPPPIAQQASVQAAADLPTAAPELPSAMTSRSRWLAVMWVLAVLALVAALTGRGRPRSF
jgi:hypothetical protein